MAELPFLKVLHVIASVASTTGGPAAAIVGMGRALHQAGIEVCIATTTAFLTHDLPKTGVITDHQGIPTIFFRYEVPPHLSISLGLRRWLQANVHNFDLVHVHGVFTYPSTIAGRVSRRNGVPYIVRPLGGLSHYSLARHHLRKRLYLALCERDYLENAAALHFTSPSEVEEASALRLHRRNFVLPLGVPEPAPVTDLEVRTFRSRHGLEGRFCLLFLGRLDPKKGLEVLFESLSQLAPEVPDWRLLVAGSGPADYAASVRAAAQQRGLAERVLFVGELQGTEKSAAFRAADVFVLPSRHENFAVAVAEAMYFGLPVIVSPEVGISRYVVERGSGIVCDSAAAPLAQSIAQLADDPERRRIMGENGRTLAQEVFSWPAIARQLSGIYRSILEAEAPNAPGALKANVSNV